jgi:dTMP kinase
MFIVFEGIDGCGKTTQTNLLANYFRKKGRKAIITKFPSNNKIGKLIKKIVLKEDCDSKVDALLFLADMIREDERTISPALIKNNIVISDRYYNSTLTYQAQEGVPINTLKYFIGNLSKPDKVFILDASVNKCLNRSKKRVSKYEKPNFMKKVKKRYKDLKFNNIIFINGDKSVKEVHEEVVSYL